VLEHLGNGGGKRVVVIRLMSPSLDNAMAELLPALKGKGWEVVANVTYDKKARNYEAVVEQVKSASPDIILMYIDNEAVPPLLKLIRKEDSLAQTRIVGGISFTFPYKLPPEILEGVTVAAPGCALSNRSSVTSSWFGTEFQRRYGKPSHMFAAFCFDSAMLIGHAIKEKGSSPAEVEAYLKMVKNYLGVTGTITFDKAGDAEVSWGIGVYRNGKLVPLEEKK
jgi:branched-chain amino acid transport system substrate-binding protein